MKKFKKKWKMIQLKRFYLQNRTKRADQRLKTALNHGRDALIFQQSTDRTPILKEEN